MDDLKKMIRALAISNAGSGMTVGQLNKDFRSLEGRDIPHQEYGFQSLDAMLRTMSDTVRISGYGSTALVQPVTNERTRHVREMVQKNKKDKRLTASKRPPLSRTRDCGYSSNRWNSDAIPSSTFDSRTFARNNDFMLSSSSDSFDLQTEEILDNFQHKNKPPPVHFGPGPPSNYNFQVNNNHQTDASIWLINNSRNESNRDDAKCNYKPIGIHDRNSNPNPNKFQQNIANEQRNRISTSPNMVSKLIKQIPPDAMGLKDKVLGTEFPHYLQPNAVVKGMVTAILDPSHMYIHLPEHTEKLLRLASNIDSMYSVKGRQEEWKMSSEMAHIGLYCVAKYYNRWHRAVIMGGLNHQRVLLSYIDYGYLRYVSLDDICYLTRELSTIPSQTIHVSLARLKPTGGKWSNACSQYLAKMVHGKIFDMSVVSVRREEKVMDLIFTDPDSNHDGISLNRRLALRDDVEYSNNINE